MLLRHARRASLDAMHGVGSSLRGDRRCSRIAAISENEISNPAENLISKSPKCIQSIADRVCRIAESPPHFLRRSWHFYVVRAIGLALIAYRDDVVESQVRQFINGDLVFIGNGNTLFAQYDCSVVREPVRRRTSAKDLVASFAIVSQQRFGNA